MRGVLVFAGVSLAVLSAAATSWPHLFDSGELVAAAWQLGASHPPGQALHALLGSAMTLVPIGPGTFRISLVSVVGATGACIAAGFVFAAVFFKSKLHSRVAVFSVVAAMTSVWTSPVLLRQATRTEVYAPALCCCLLSVFLAVRFRMSKEPGVRGAASLRRSFWLSGLAVGFAWSLHPPHALAAGLLVLPWLPRTPGARSTARSVQNASSLASCLSACAFFGLGALAVALPLACYLPMRAAAGSPMWGDPLSIEGLVDYLSGRAYRSNLSADPLAMFEHGAQVLGYAARRGYGIHVLGVAALLGLTARWPVSFRRGLTRIVGRSSKVDERVPSADTLGVHGAGLRLLLGAVLALVPASLQPFSPDNPDVLAYAGPTLVCLRLASICGLVLLAERLLDLARSINHSASCPPANEASAAPPHAQKPVQSQPAASSRFASLTVHPSRRRQYLCLGAACCAACVSLLEVPPQRLGRALRPEVPALERFSHQLSDVAPPRSLIVAKTDFVAGALLERRATEGARPDLAVFIQGLSTSSWHWKAQAYHPAFDGEPARLANKNLPPKVAYAGGAVRDALAKVPALVESAELSGTYGLPQGPYMALLPSKELGARAHEWQTHLATLRELTQSPAEDAAQAVILHYASVRAARDFAKGHHSSAMETLSAAIPAKLEGLPSLSCPEDAPRAARLFVEPGHYLATRGDLVRQAACYLWHCNRPEDAMRLLHQQSREGDPFGQLQLSWLYAQEGSTRASQEANAKFDAAIKKGRP